MQQITDTKTLRKLLNRIEEIPEVKKFLEELVAAKSDNEASPSTTFIQFQDTTTKVWVFEKLIALKKVKENQHMSNLLLEIAEYIKFGNLEAAQSVAKRVLEAPKAVAGQPRPPKAVRVMQEAPDLVMTVSNEPTEEPTVEEL